MGSFQLQCWELIKSSLYLLVIWQACCFNCRVLGLFEVFPLVDFWQMQFPLQSNVPSSSLSFFFLFSSWKLNLLSNQAISSIDHRSLRTVLSIIPKQVVILTANNHLYARSLSLILLKYTWFGGTWMMWGLQPKLWGVLSCVLWSQLGSRSVLNTTIGGT